MTKSRKPIVLSDLQLDVVRVLWQHGETATPEVVQALVASRGLAHTTVATLLTRLEKRGVVAARRDGRQLLYSAKVSESEVKRSMVAELVSSLFGGDSSALLAHLVREDELRPGDLAEVQALLKAERPATGGDRHG